MTASVIDHLEALTHTPAAAQRGLIVACHDEGEHAAKGLAAPSAVHVAARGEDCLCKLVVGVQLISFLAQTLEP